MYGFAQSLSFQIPTKPSTARNINKYTCALYTSAIAGLKIKNASEVRLKIKKEQGHEKYPFETAITIR